MLQLNEKGTIIEVKGWEEMVKKLDLKFIRGPVWSFLQRCGIKVQGESMKRANVDTGLMRSSIGYEVDTSEMPKFVRIGTRVFYAPYQEYGTGLMAESGSRPRHWPPGEALSLWAERHGAPSGAAVARVIGNRGGLIPRRFLREGLRASMSSIHDYLKTMGDEIESKWKER